MKIAESRVKAIRLALSLTFFTQGIAALSWIPRIPEFIENLGVTKDVWGAVIGIGGIGALVPLVFTNRLVARFGTTPIIRITSLTMCFIFMALPYPTQWWLFLVLHFTLSVVISTFNIALNSQAVVFKNLSIKFCWLVSMVPGASVLLPQLRLLELLQPSLH